MYKVGPSVKAIRGEDIQWKIIYVIAYKGVNRGGGWPTGLGSNTFPRGGSRGRVQGVRTPPP